jgi:predicted RNase H-like nuclease (RuvC/YqgF family)
MKETSCQKKYKDDLDKKSTELQNMKEKNNELTNQLKQSKKEKDELKKKLEELKSKSATEKTPSDVNECVKNTVKEEIPDVKKTNEPLTESHIPSRMYANVDVNESSLLFTKVQENSGKRSVFEINTQKKTFVIINDEDIYSQLLQNPNSSGVMNGCEVMGTFSKGKSVSVTPGHVRKEGNGWKIVEKCKIVIE